MRRAYETVGWVRGAFFTRAVTHRAATRWVTLAPQPALANPPYGPLLASV
jgi:hypothetical protein